eukprot:6456119-Amphidinium_carterae.1
MLTKPLRMSECEVHRSIIGLCKTGKPSVCAHPCMVDRCVETGTLASAGGAATVGKLNATGLALALMHLAHESCVSFLAGLLELNAIGVNVRVAVKRDRSDKSLVPFVSGHFGSRRHVQ